MRISNDIYKTPRSRQYIAALVPESIAVKLLRIQVYIFSIYIYIYTHAKVVFIKDVNTTPHSRAVSVLQ